MTTSLYAWLIVIGGYLLGSILPADWFIRKKKGQSALDLDENPGGMGTYRQAGSWAAAFVSLFDIAKGILPVALADTFGLHNGWLAAAAAAPVIGHNWPFYKRFRGGKGLAAALGAIGWLGWPYILPAYILGGAAALWRRWAPMMGLVAFPVGLVLMIMGDVPVERIWATAVISMVLVVRQLPWLWSQVSKRKAVVREG